MKKITTEEREITITNKDGSVTKVKGIITTTDHGVKDKNGNPKISKNINIPAAAIGAEPGKNGE